MELDRTLGEVWLSMSNFEAAEAALTRVRLHARAAGNRELEHQARIALAEAAQRQGRNEQAKAELEFIVAAAPREPSSLLRRAYQTLAEAQGQSRRARQGTRLDARSRAHRHRVVRARQRRRPAHGLRGRRKRWPLRFRYAEAAGVLQPLVERWRAGGKPEDQRLANALHNLVVSQFETGKAEDAIAHMRQLLELRRRIYAAPHEAIAGTLRNLAGLLQLRGEYAEAVAPARRGAGRCRSRCWAATTCRSRARSTPWAWRWSTTGAPRKAKAKYAEVAAICERINLQDDVCPRSLANLGQSYYERGLLEEAAASMRAALERRIALFGAEHANVAISRSRLAILEAERGHADESIALAQASFAVLEKAGRADSREGAIAKSALAAGLSAANREPEALEAVDAALASWKDSYGHERRISMLILRASILTRLARPAKARQAAHDAEAAIRDSELSPTQRTRLREQLQGPFCASDRTVQAQAVPASFPESGARLRASSFTPTDRLDGEARCEESMRRGPGAPEPSPVSSLAWHSLSPAMPPKLPPSFKR